MSPNDSCYYMKASSSLNQWHRGTCLSGGFWSSSRCVRGLSENWGRMRSDKLCSVYRYRYRCSMGILYCCGYSMDIDWHIYIYTCIYICTNTYKYQINTQMHGICTEVLPGNLPIITFGFVSVCWMCFSMFFHVFLCFQTEEYAQVLRLSTRSQTRVVETRQVRESVTPLKASDSVPGASSGSSPQKFQSVPRQDLRYG